MSDNSGGSARGCLPTAIVAAIITVLGTGIFGILNIVVDRSQELSNDLTKAAIQTENEATYDALRSARIEVIATPEASRPEPTAIPATAPPPTRPPIIVRTTIPAVAVCSGSPPTQLMGQREAQVVPNTGVGNIRLGIESGTSLKVIPEGGIVDILDGPVCGPSHFQQTWYKVRSGDTVGWMSEGNTREYWLQPPR